MHHPQCCRRVCDAQIKIEAQSPPLHRPAMQPTRHVHSAPLVHRRVSTDRSPGDIKAKGWGAHWRCGRSRSQRTWSSPTPTGGQAGAAHAAPCHTSAGCPPRVLQWHMPEHLPEVSLHPLCGTSRAACAPQRHAGKGSPRWPVGRPCATPLGISLSLSLWAVMHTKDSVCHGMCW